MTHDQLLPVYRRITGLPGSDDTYNRWVQGIIDASGSGGTDAIPDNFFNTPQGQAYVQSTATQPLAQNPGGSGFSSFIPETPTTNPPPFTQAPAPNVPGGNYNQVQNSNQGGQFTTVGNTSSEQNQTTGSTQTGTQTGTQTQTTTGTTTTTPTDTLGFGGLLKGQAGGVSAADDARLAFLTDVMNTGGTGFNSQLDEGIRSSLTGPQMTGAGDSARARAAGYAAANVGRNNLNQRLGAAQQLTAPTGLSALSAAANPYIGTSTTNTGSTDSISNLVNNVNTTGFSDLISKGSEAQSGATTAQSSQAGAGQIPQGQPVKTGGCVLCTAAIELKLPRSNMTKVLRRVIGHKLRVERKRFSNASRGYFAVFTPFAAWLLSHPKLARRLWPLARAVVYEELRVSGRRLPLKPVPWIVHWTGHTFCTAVGAVLPVKGYVDDERILTIARRNNILFKLEN